MNVRYETPRGVTKFNYAWAAKELTGRCKLRRKVGNNTYLERDSLDGAIYLRLHCTRIVTYYPDGNVKLNSGGWMTVTTKERMNRFSPFRLWSTGGEWTATVGITLPYFDGISLATFAPYGGPGNEYSYCRPSGYCPKHSSTVVVAMCDGEPRPVSTGARWPESFLFWENYHLLKDTAPFIALRSGLVEEITVSV